MTTTHKKSNTAAPKRCASVLYLSEAELPLKKHL